MDIKEKISEIVETLTQDEDLLKNFKKDPVKVVERLLGVDLPDDIIEKIVEGVKAKVSLDQIGDVLGAFKKLF